MGFIAPWVLDGCSTDQIASHFPLKGCVELRTEITNLILKSSLSPDIFLDSEIRSLKMPPDAIRDVLEGVLRLMGNYDTSWLNMKKFLGTRTVKEEIMNFNAQRITKDLVQDVQKLMARKPNSFEHHAIYHVSVAAAPLAGTVLHSYNSSTVQITCRRIKANKVILLSCRFFAAFSVVHLLYNSSRFAERVEIAAGTMHAI